VKNYPKPGSSLPVSGVHYDVFQLCGRGEEKGGWWRTDREKREKLKYNGRWIFWDQIRKTHFTRGGTASWGGPGKKLVSGKLSEAKRVLSKIGQCRKKQFESLLPEKTKEDCG